MSFSDLCSSVLRAALRQPARRTAPPGPAPRRRTASRAGRPSRRRSSCRSETTSRAPLIPSGWPSAIAPPFTLTRSSSRPSSRQTASDCEANASLSSTRSISSIETPGAGEELAHRGHRADAHHGRVDPGDGRAGEDAERLDPERARLLLARDHERCSAVVDPARVARRHRPVRRGTRAAARPSFSSVVSGRGCSSRTSSPAGTSSSSNRPASAAAAQRCCERSANASWSARETPQRSATFSPVSPIALGRVPLLVARVDEPPAERRVVERPLAVARTARPAWR